MDEQEKRQQKKQHITILGLEILDREHFIFNLVNIYGVSSVWQRLL